MGEELNFEDNISIEEAIKQLNGVILIDTCMLSSNINEVMFSANNYEHIKADFPSHYERLERIAEILVLDNVYVIQEVFEEFKTFKNNLKKKENFLDNGLNNWAVRVQNRNRKSKINLNSDYNPLERFHKSFSKCVENQSNFGKYIQLIERNLGYLNDFIINPGEINYLLDGVCRFKAEKNREISCELKTDEKLIAGGLALSQDEPTHILTKDIEIFKIVSEMSKEKNITDFFEKDKGMVRTAALTVVYFDSSLNYISLRHFPRYSTKKTERLRKINK